MTLIYCLSLAKVADILDFTHNAMFHVVVYHTTMSGIPEDIMIDTKVISLYQICQKMALIDRLTLDVTHNARPEVFFDQTNMSGIPENPMVDTKIMNLHQLCTQLALVYCFTLGSDGHLGFS